VTRPAAEASRQQELFRFLTQSGTLAGLRSFHPFVAGTIPLGIDVPGSDVDIICEAQDLDEFEAIALTVLADGGAIRLQARRKSVRGIPTAIIRGKVTNWALEIFGQDVPVRRQYAVRHLLVERRILALGGPEVRRRIMSLRSAGRKTESAFAGLLRLPGDPYEAVLTLESWADEEILERLMVGRRN
jgi:hypothetical protein